ncbi:glycosyltransferase [Ectobacillus sp. JY-23]|uniref:glycosyltransferase n=1 Tax=Ectobacillus sp. JY-23 TaxID=2933872 RepID=UPI001FF238BB|nr:glycosyltransferase [Ectobacillus sp. JY-23]UOY92702.1 glycosyltransferase [Ectobacillus sp. JY-23]
MKKKILFVIPSLTAGGGEKSLVNLLSQIDFSLYEVDLFLFHHEGLFVDFVPKEVRIIPLPESYKTFTLPLISSVRNFLSKGNVSLAWKRVLFSMQSRLGKNVSVREQYSWRYMADALPTLEGKYDAAIGFLEKTATYFCIDKVQAHKTIGWVHIDYNKLGMDATFDRPYFQKVNHIVTVSEECANILIDCFPDVQDKVRVIYNIVSPTVICNMAKKDLADTYLFQSEQIKILSIGRLHYQKGLEFAIEACKILVDKGYNVQWNIIGEGEEREKLTSLIVNKGLENHVKLLGLKANPYPYIQQADIYAQTSRFEGKSIAIDEAKILQKPILVTNFSTAKDQIMDGHNGLIVDMTPQAIAQGIEKLMDKTLRQQLAYNLAKEKLGTEEEIQKLYDII